MGFLDKIFNKKDVDMTNSSLAEEKEAVTLSKSVVSLDKVLVNLSKESKTKYGIPCCKSGCSYRLFW